ncbi:hypothetical protein KM043_003830 [Ampulex compressa]|nr:hypothetical protein KM043_003830 [Ampulex compressa]
MGRRTALYWSIPWARHRHERGYSRISRRAVGREKIRETYGTAVTDLRAPPTPDLGAIGSTTRSKARASTFGRTGLECIGEDGQGSEKVSTFARIAAQRGEESGLGPFRQGRRR